MARQKLGQHFLASGKILEKIALAACGSGVALAVEIGPGRGALTTHLLAHAQRVAAIELDAELVTALLDRFRGETRLDLRQADALKADFSGPEFSCSGDCVLAGNLPYYAATAIILRYLRKPGQLRHGVFLIQKEVAERIVARPHTRDYGYLSVECQYLAKAEYLFSVPPGAFRPPPQVDSAVIRLTPHSPAAEIEPEIFLDFVSACFRQKRKTLRNNLASRYPREVLGGSLRTDRRAEELSIAEFMDLYRGLASTP